VASDDTTQPSADFDVCHGARPSVLSAGGEVCQRVRSAGRNPVNGALQAAKISSGESLFVGYSDIESGPFMSSNFMFQDTPGGSGADGLREIPAFPAMGHGRSECSEPTESGYLSRKCA